MYELLNLLQAWKAGADAAFACRDCLLQLGYPATAEWHFDHACCVRTWCSLADSLLQAKDTEEWLMEEERNCLLKLLQERRLAPRTRGGL